MSGPWGRFASGPWQRFSPPAQNESDVLGSAVGRGASLGFGDEMTAAVRATMPEVSDWMMRGPALQREGDTAPPARETSKAGTWKERYEEELRKTRGQTKADREAYPALTTGGEIAGNLALAGVALPAGLTAAGPTLTGNMVKMGLTGGLLGGAQGFGEGEGVDDRLAKAAMGAGVGGAVGAATPVAGLAARSLAESAPGRWVGEKIVGPTLRSIGSLFGESVPARALSAAAPDGSPPGPIMALAQKLADPAEQGAADRIATALQRAKLDPERVKAALANLGPEATLADVDPQLLSLARMANTMPGETRSMAKTVLEGRDRQAGNRLVSAFEGGEPPPSSYALRGEGQAFDQNVRAVGSRAYGDMADAGLKQSPELMALYENPDVRGALDRILAAEKATRAGGVNRAPASPVEIMHKVKEAIEAKAYGENGLRAGPEAQWYRDLARDFVAKFKAANPAAAEADAAYAQAKSLPEFFDAGRSFLGRGSSEKATANSAPALADLLLKADPQQRLAARAGSTNAARETALEGTNMARALARRIDESSPVRDKLVELYGSQQGGRIMKQAAAEKTFADTSNEILRGSKTADKIAEVLDTGSLAIRGTPSSIQPRILERLDAIVNRLAGPNEAVRNKIGQAMLRTDSEENKRLLQAVADVLAKRARGNPLGAGLSVGLSGAAQ